MGKLYVQITTSRSFELSRSFYISIPWFKRVLMEIFIEGKRYISLSFDENLLNICVSVCWISFVYTSRADHAHDSKFKNSNAKFRFRITTFSAYISYYDRKLFLYFFSVFQNVQSGFKIVSSQILMVCTVRHLE